MKAWHFTGIDEPLVRVEPRTRSPDRVRSSSMSRTRGCATRTCPATALVKIPEGVSFALGAAGTDAGMTSHAAVISNGQVKAGDKVGIIGFGGRGQIGARVAVLAGAGVYVAETNESVWENVRVDGRVVQVGMGRLEATISTKWLILKSVTLVGSQGGTIEDVKGVYDYFATGESDPAITEITFDEIPAGSSDSTTAMSSAGWWPSPDSAGFPTSRSSRPFPLDRQEPGALPSRQGHAADGRPDLPEE